MDIVAEGNRVAGIIKKRREENPGKNLWACYKNGEVYFDRDVEGAVFQRYYSIEGSHTEMDAISGTVSLETKICNQVRCVVESMGPYCSKSLMSRAVGCELDLIGLDYEINVPMVMHHQSGDRRIHYVDFLINDEICLFLSNSNTRDSDMIVKMTRVHDQETMEYRKYIFCGYYLMIDCLNYEYVSMSSENGLFIPEALIFDRSFMVPSRQTAMDIENLTAVQRSIEVFHMRLQDIIDEWKKRGFKVSYENERALTYKGREMGTICPFFVLNGRYAIRYQTKDTFEQLHVNKELEITKLFSKMFPEYVCIIFYCYMKRDNAIVVAMSVHMGMT